MLLVLLQGCGGGGESSVVLGETPAGGSADRADYSYLPTKINSNVAVKFLNKATFGATKSDLQSLQKLGVRKWVEQQLELPKSSSPYLTKMIQVAKEFKPQENPDSLKEYLADNAIVFNKKRASFHSPTYFSTAWFTQALEAKDQLRHKTAYLLSQILVESDFEPVFTRRSEALARYFDILYSGAFGGYGDLLYAISTNSGMALFLTFNGSKKAYKNDAGIWVFPDENYARELMQLFSIGLNKLNIDATPKKDSKGDLIPTYTQKDVNELARVFTGFDLQRSYSDYWENPKDIYGLSGFKTGDFTHMVEFSSAYHDDGNKTVLGTTIQGGDGFEELKSVIAVLMANENIAPYIAKKLIMRFAKSNPSPAYVQRVATVFKESKGELKRVVKAILLDKELWDDLQNNKVTKFKEPLVAYTQFLRALRVQPAAKFVFCGYGQPVDENASNCTWVENEYSFYKPNSYLGQGAGFAPDVFNFYDDEYVPNNTDFKSGNLKAPESQILSDSIMIEFANTLKENLRYEKNDLLLGSKKSDGWVSFDTIDEYATYAISHKYVSSYYVRVSKFMLDLSNYYEIYKQNIGGSFDNVEECLGGCKDPATKKAIAAVLDEVDNTMLGGGLDVATKNTIVDMMMKIEIYNHYRDGEGIKIKQRVIYNNVIVPLISLVATTDYYMSE